MKPSRVAISLLASTWPAEVAAAAKLRRNQETVGPEGSTAWEGDGHATDPCWTAREKAAELVESAMSGCGAAAANPSWTDQGAVAPNPTCLLLLCAARRAGTSLILAEGCAVADPPYPEGDICDLVPGLVPPADPVANDDFAGYSRDPDGDSIAIDVLANDEAAFEQTLQLTGVTTGPPVNGECSVSGDQVVYTANFPDYDSGVQTCEYEVCYVGRYSNKCATAMVYITVTGAPTPSPTMSPTVDRCKMSVDAEAVGDFPPSGFDPIVSCSEKPNELTLKLNGGPCQVPLDNPQEGRAMCEDFDGGPSTEGRKYVVVEDAAFSEGVDVGSTFTLTPDGDKFSSDMYINIYADSSMETKLQALKIHVSCSKPLNLSDKFGAVQVFGWVDYYGTVSLEQPLQITTNVMNNDDKNATMTALTLDVDGGVTNLIEGPVTVMNGETQSYPNDYLVDTTVGLVEYLATASYVGGHGLECSPVEDGGSVTWTS